MTSYIPVLDAEDHITSIHPKELDPHNIEHTAHVLGYETMQLFISSLKKNADTGSQTQQTETIGLEPSND